MLHAIVGETFRALMRMAVCVVAAGYPLLAVAGGDLPSSQLTGKCGAQLKSALRWACRPKVVTGADDMMNVLLGMDTDVDGRIVDRYTANRYVTGGDVRDLVVDGALPAAWWSGSKPDYGDTVSRDMHNLVICHKDVAEAKAGYPPGRVNTSVITLGGWHMGYGAIAGEQVMVHEPAPEMRGDFARTVFYMVTMYPVKMWNGLGINVLADGDYPSISRYGLEVLLQWHADDQVDERERARSEAVAAVQGNVNPFVSDPELVQYVWGDKSHVPWGDNPVDPEPGYSGTLRGEYSIGDTIYLSSPYVPSDAGWSIDGKRAESSSVKASSLGRGEHELRYVRDGVKGKIKIRIL